MIKGKLHLYFETGMEGCEWVVLNQKRRDFYKSLTYLENGDRLRVYDNKKVVWEGEIKHDTKTNLTDKTGYPYPRQVVKNYIVHWLQQGVDPDKWAQWCLEEKDCELDRKKLRKSKLEARV